MEKIKRILGITLILAVLLSGVQFAAQPSASASEPLSDSNEVPAITPDEPTSAVLEAPLVGESLKLKGIEEPRGAWFGVTENFEGAWPGSDWTVFDNDSPPSLNGEYYWGATTCYDFGVSGDNDAVPHCDGSSAMYTCYQPYPANLNSWMVWGPFDLTGFITAEVSFDLNLHSESGADYFKWMASINGTKFSGYQTSGDTGGWVTKDLDLTNVPTLGNVCGQSQVWIALVFQSDSISGSYAGPWVDDVSLEASSEPLLNYITTADNENNYHTGTADGDMYPANPDCIYNNNYKPNCPSLQNPLAPIEFNIVVPTLPSFTTAELSLYAWDVDEQGDASNPTRPKERDEVYLNGHFLGTLTGADQVWSTSHFNIPDPSWVQQGNNLVEVSIDVYDGCWCVMIDWGQLVLGGGGGQAFIRSWGPLMDCWPPGTQQHVMVEVDTSLSSQDVLVEVKVVDSQNVTLIQDSDTKTINGSQDDDFLFLLDVPTTAATGYYTLEVIVYDAHTYVQQDYDYQTVEINPACGPPSPCTVHLESYQDNYATSNKGTITFHSISYSLPDDASVGQGSYYATYYPDSGYEFVSWDWSGNISVSNSNSQTTSVQVSCGGTLTAIYELYQKPDPCTVEGDKTAQPDTVDAGDKVWVTITLHGLGDCPVTAEHADVMLVIDRSGSMSGTPLQDAKNAAKAFVDRLDLSSGGDQVGLVSYSDSATLDHQLSTNASSVKAAIDGLVSGGYTNITDGINKAQAELDSGRHEPANQPVIILMTDGEHNVGAVPGPAADAAKAKGTRIFTIGLGSVNAAQLQSLASSPSDYYYAPTSSDLEAIYQQIAGALMTGVPARDLTLVDVLSDDVTYIPGSASPVPDSISPDNKTLTWEIATLGRNEWKTFTYQVTISQTAEGLVCINDSTTATYTDSNGDPATLHIPPACVTVVSGEWYYKPGYSDYAPNGIPDFDQRQDQWDNPPGSGNWSYCGPLAVANCLWWFDSKMEPYPIPPPTINDNYPLLQSYSPGQWDDHDPWNLPYFVEDLAYRMDTDAQRTNDPYHEGGTYPDDMYNAILGYLADHGLAGSYEVTMMSQPTFEWVAAEVGRCENVILELGFWTWGQTGWERLGGHFVTTPGVDPVGGRIAFSDPTYDRAEEGDPGRVLDGILISHSPVPGHASSVHNDAGNISHDSYHAVSTDSPGGTWGPAGYFQGYEAMKHFFGQNFPRDFPQEFKPKKESQAYVGTTIQTEVEYAIAISPSAAPPCTVEGDKTAHPDQVEPGGETTVVITLDGLGDCPSVAKNADVMLVIDRSGSMSGTPLQDAKNAAKAFVDRLDLTPGGDQAGLVSYSDSATLNTMNHQLSRSRVSIRAAVDGLVSGGNTNITDGINKAQTELESARHDPANGPVIILMTDGMHNVGPVPGPAADAAKAKGTRIFTIGLGSVDAAQLQSLASSTSDYYYAATSDELDYIYQQIAGSLMGLPATNITLVDRLSNDVTYIAGSAWPVPYSISPDNKVLTWKIPTLGRNQTRTFTYRVKVSQTAQGVVCINDSTTATYTDSNGHTATLNIPPACVTVKLQSHDCYCKDHDGDDGSVPSNPNGEAWWESPDIWVRHQQDGIEQHQNPEGCQINYVYAKVRNRGNTTMTNIEVDLYWSDGAVAIVWPGGWTYIGTATISSLAAGQVRVVNVPWHPLVSGHYCFLERIHSTQDPVKHEGLVPFDNNLCQKNVQVIETTDEGWSDNDVTVRNPQDNSVQTDVTIDSTNYPPDGTVTVDVDPDVFDKWQDNGGDLQGGHVIPGTTSMQLDVSPTGEVAATIGRIPLDASEETTMELTLGVGAQTSPKAGEQAGIQPKLDAAGSKARVGVRQIIEGQDVGGSVYGPPTEIAPVAEGLENIMDKLEVVYSFHDGEWTWYNPGWPPAANTLTTLYVGRGYWVKASGVCNLTYGANSYQLDEGWNLIGWLGYWEQVGANPNVAAAVTPIVDSLEVVYGFYDGDWTWYNPDWPSAANTLTTLYIGRGYWLKMGKGCSLEYGDNTYGLDVGWNLIGWLG